MVSPRKERSSAHSGDKGSTYEVEIAGNGGSDRIAVSGTANGQRYTVLTATGGVRGGASAISRSAFLDLTMDQQPNQVDLVIAVKGAPPVTPTDPSTPPVAPPAVFQTFPPRRAWSDCESAARSPLQQPLAEPSILYQSDSSLPRLTHVGIAYWDFSI